MNASLLFDASDALIQAGHQRLRVLVVTAAPLLEQQPLHLRSEWQILRRELADGALPAALIRLLPPSREALVRTLDRAAASDVAPHVLHFAGHGEKDHLLFETALGELFRYGNDALASDLRGRGVRLVFLNACKTAPEDSLSLARYLVTSGAVEAAIGHTTLVADDAALLFASRLYRRLSQGERLRDAFEAAKEALKSQFRVAAECTNLFGDGSLHFGELGAGSPLGAFSFDGTAGRGRMPEVPHFFGRSEELVSIGRFFEALGQRVLAISGLGGLGKTALALEAASRHAWRFPGGLAFSSARAQVLGAPTAESLIRSVMAALTLPPAPTEELVERLFSYLQKSPGLLVLDQLDDLAPTELERLVRILEQLPLNGSKVILTLRTAPQLLREWPWLRPLTLASGLSERAGCDYLVHAAQGRVPELFDSRPANGKAESLPLRLSRALSGHPKLLDIAVDIAATRGVSALGDVVKELSEFDSAAVARDFTEALEARMETFLGSVSSLLDADGRWILSFFPHSPDGTFTRYELQAAARAVEQTAGRPAPAPARFTSGLSACVKAGLLEHVPEPELYRVHPTVQWHLSRRVPDPGTAVRLGLIEHCITFVNSHLRDHAALEWRLSFLMAIFERAWRDKEVTDALRRRVLATIDQMGSFFAARFVPWPNMSDWMRRLEEMHGETLAARARRLYHKGMLLFRHVQGQEPGQQQRQGQLTEAKHCLQESVDISRRLGLHREHVDSLGQLAMIALVEGRPQDARCIVEEYMDVVRALDSQPDEALALYFLAAIEFRNGYFQKARELLLKAVGKLQGTSLRHKEVRAIVFMMLGIVMSITGDHAEGSQFIAEGVTLIKNLGGQIGESVFLQMSAIDKHSHADFLGAHSFISKALHIRTDKEYSYGRVALIMQRAAYEREQGQLAQAIESLNEARKLLGKEGYLNEHAMILNELAAVHLAQGTESAARMVLDEALKIAEQVGDEFIRAMSLKYLSMLEYSKRNYAQARTYANEALALFTTIGNQINQAELLHHLGLIDARQGQDAQAAEHLRESLRLKDKFGKRMGRVPSLVMLAQVEGRLGQRDEALKYIREALALMEKTGSYYLPMARAVLMDLSVRPSKGESPARVPSWMAQLSESTERYIRAGRPEKALGGVRAAIATCAEQNRYVTLAMLYAYEAQVLEIAGRPYEARESIDKALTIAESAGQHEQVDAIRDYQQHIESLCEQARRSA